MIDRCLPSGRLCSFSAILLTAVLMAPIASAATHDVVFTIDSAASQGRHGTLGDLGWRGKR